MRDKDSLLVLLGLLILGLTFVFCGERLAKTPSPIATQKPAPVSGHAPKIVESPSLSAVAIKKKIDDLFVGKTVTFQTDSAVILPEGLVLLNAVVPILQDDPKALFEIGGHTDNAGSEQKNQLLSERRAKAVAEYLISKGVAAHRLWARGYGASQPIADNMTVEGRAHNRRIEFSVRAKGERP